MGTSRSGRPPHAEPTPLPVSGPTGAERHAVAPEHSCTEWLGPQLWRAGAWLAGRLRRPVAMTVRAGPGPVVFPMPVVASIVWSR